MNKNQTDIFSGIGLGISFITTGVILPLLFQNKFILMFAAILIAFGIMGLGMGLEKFYANLGFTNIGLGIGITLLAFSILVVTINVFTKMLFILILLLGLYGFITGILQYLSNKTSFYKNNSPKNKKGPSLTIASIFSITGFIANVIAILSYFHH